MEVILNNRIVRIIIGTAIGIPLTAISVVLGLHGLVLLYAGIKEMELVPFSMGLVTVTGFIGIYGAWKRIFKSSDEMTESERSKVRIMLGFGFLSSLGLALWALSSSEAEATIIMLLLAVGAIAFIYATPKKL